MFENETQPEPIDMTEILTEATRIATIHLPQTAREVAAMSESFVNHCDRNMSRFVSLMIDDSRDESSDYFSNLSIEEYNRRYDSLHSLLTAMLYPVIIASVTA